MKSLTCNDYEHSYLICCGGLLVFKWHPIKNAADTILIKNKNLFLFLEDCTRSLIIFFLLSLILGVVEVKIGRGENITGVIVLYRKNTLWVKLCHC